MDYNTIPDNLATRYKQYDDWRAIHSISYYDFDQISKTSRPDTRIKNKTDKLYLSYTIQIL